MREPAPFRAVSTFESRAVASCRPSEVIAALRDGDGTARHLVPVPIDVETQRGRGLRRGTRARVVARLAGHVMTFDVKVLAAGSRALRVAASGPFDVELAATFQARERLRTEILGRFILSGRPRSLADRLFLRAGEGLLAGGALDLAAHQLASRSEAMARARGAAAGG